MPKAASALDSHAAGTYNILGLFRTSGSRLTYTIDRRVDLNTVSSLM